MNELTVNLKNVTTAAERKQGDDNTMEFTEKGEELFKNATGNECSWGGPKLIAEI